MPRSKAPSPKTPLYDAENFVVDRRHTWTGTRAPC